MLIIKSSTRVIPNHLRCFSSKPPGFDLFNEFIDEKIQEKKVIKEIDLKAQIEKVLDKDDADIKLFEATKADKAGKGAGGAGKMQKPLVIIGPVCSGKSTLINYLKFNKPRYFEHIPNYTSKSDFLKSEIKGLDYKVAPGGDQFFMRQEEQGQMPLWLLKYKTDQSSKTGLHVSSTGMYGNKGQSSYWTGSLL